MFESLHMRRLSSKATQQSPSLIFRRLTSQGTPQQVPSESSAMFHKEQAFDRGLNEGCVHQSPNCSQSDLTSFQVPQPTLFESAQHVFAAPLGSTPPSKLLPLDYKAKFQRSSNNYNVCCNIEKGKNRATGKLALQSQSIKATAEVFSGQTAVAIQQTWIFQIMPLARFEAMEVSK